MESKKPLQLLALNHVSRVCSDLDKSYRFYTEVLGFTPVKRPSSFTFEGAWLHNYGIGLHLIKGCPPPRPKAINPRSCHISFQATSLTDVEESLVREGIPFIKNVFSEEGFQVGQLFFHDPDDNMIEICNCDVLPVVPLIDANQGTLALATAVASTLPFTPAAVSSTSLVAGSSSSDAGSDTESLHSTFEATSLLSEDVTAAADTADTVAAAAEPATPSSIDCDQQYCTDGTAVSLHESGGSSFCGTSAVSPSVFVTGNPFSDMSINASDLIDWRRL